MVTRREILAAGAFVAGSALSLSGTRSAIAQTAAAPPPPAQQGWDEGDLAHLLPTSSHERILLKASFKRPLETAPILRVGDQRVVGVRSDTRGLF